MNRAQFMEQLKKLLSDIPEEERREALEYYESYFDEAGEEREAEVIRELGSPGKVAAIIKADLEGSRNDRGEYTETGYHDNRTEEEFNPPAERIALLPAVLVIAAAAAVILLAIAGIVFLCSGIGLCFTNLPDGVMAIGISLILLALMLAAGVLLFWLAARLLPRTFQKFTDFCSNVLNKGRKKEKEESEV